MANQRYTKGQMIFMLERYKSDAGIARFLGVSRQSVRSQRVRLGIPSSKTKVPERNAMIMRLHKKGSHFDSIAKLVSLTPRHVKSIVEKESKNDTDTKQ